MFNQYFCFKKLNISKTATCFALCAGVQTRLRSYFAVVTTNEYTENSCYYRGADKSLARPGRKQAQKHNRDTRDFNNIETRAVIKFIFFLQGKAPKEIHAILREASACFLPSRSKDLLAPL